MFFLVLSDVKYKCGLKNMLRENNGQAAQISDDEQTTRPDLKLVEKKNTPPPPSARELRFGERAMMQTISSIDAYIREKYPQEKEG